MTLSDKKGLNEEVRHKNLSRNLLDESEEAGVFDSLKRLNERGASGLELILRNVRGKVMKSAKDKSKSYNLSEYKTKRALSVDEYHKWVKERTPYSNSKPFEEEEEVGSNEDAIIINQDVYRQHKR